MKVLHLPLLMILDLKSLKISAINLQDTVAISHVQKCATQDLALRVDISAL